MSVFGIVLAAGRGRRMGGAKHLIEVDGRPMLTWVVAALQDAGVDGIVGVLRPPDPSAEALLEELGASRAWAEPADEGRAASVRAGVRAAGREQDLLFALADQPFLVGSDFRELIGGLIGPRAEGGGGIVHASYAGERGSPVLFAAAYREELLALEGAQGGREVIAAHPDELSAVELDPHRGRDVDEPSDVP